MACAAFLFGNAQAQGDFDPTAGIDSLVIECYYQADANDNANEDGGPMGVGATTYRVYLDMKPGFTVKSVFGTDLNRLKISTTSVFFNNEDRGEELGTLIENNRLDENTVALDSWVTIGGASDEHMGVFKVNDTDGSLLLYPNDEGLLANTPPSELYEPSLDSLDGMVPNITPPSISLSPGLDLEIFGDENLGGEFIVGGEDYEGTGDTWFVGEGVMGVDSLNQVLIGQFTTDGELSLELNVTTNDTTLDLGYKAVGVYDPEAQIPGEELILTDVPFLAQELVVCTPFNATGIAEYQPLNKHLDVMPNPTTGATTVRLQHAELGASEIRYTLFDSQGRVIESGTEAYSEGWNKDLDMEALPSGMYIFRLEADQALGLKRIFKY